MTKSSFEAIKAAYGKKICVLIITQMGRYFVGYGEGGNAKTQSLRVDLDDLAVETYGDTDFLAVTRINTSQGTKPLKQKTLTELSMIQQIVICDEEPMEFKKYDPKTNSYTTETGYARIDPYTV